MYDVQGHEDARPKRHAVSLQASIGHVDTLVWVVAVSKLTGTPSTMRSLMHPVKLALHARRCTVPVWSVTHGSNDQGGKWLAWLKRIQ